MRLLRYDEQGELVIVSFDDRATPRYAILSHTWGADAEEVTFADLATGDGKAKRGYEKIRICGQQAQQDGIQHFWVDTCCIDKTDKAELSHAIRSMFRWYQNATKCYVYLSDVSTRKRKADDMLDNLTWESAFKASRWFTRGWTLQELLAPRTVEFFSREGVKLGDKKSHKLLIHKITSVSLEALDGASLSEFSVNERLRWNGGRVTKREEDGAYSLQGILDVELAPVYGEGAAGAFRRLMDEIHELERCIQNMHSTDPRDDKKRIEEAKGGLLTDSYRWILDNTIFQQWQQKPHSRLLWVKGDPGKGKTMLLCGIIDELHSSRPETATLAYFFCQATDLRINNATAVLRGLLYMLIRQQPSLVSYVRKKHDHAGKKLFEDANAWVALTEIFADVIRDQQLRATYLIIDALDECVTDLPKLLHFIAKQSSASSRVKWIVSSRNWPEIEEQLRQAWHKAKLSLELNAESVSAAVDAFIKHRVSQLTREKSYDKQTQNAVLERLTTNADNTFLWVALVCQELQSTARRNVTKKLNTFPPGLNALYERMMQYISASDDAELCKQVLAVSALVYRPIMLEELSALLQPIKPRACKPIEHEACKTELREIIGHCGSFLTLQEDAVYFVHQSAKDFLFAKAYNEVFPHGAKAIHHVIYSRSLTILSNTLRRDMYSLQALEVAIEDVQPPKPDPLAALRYSCVYWIDHLCDSKPKSWAEGVGDPKAAGAVDEFIRKKYIYWLEALSLCRSMGKGVVSMAKLCSLVQEMQDSDELTRLVQDASRFVMYHKGAIENYPLQTYASALLFSPTGSTVKRLFQHQAPTEVTVKPTMNSGWSACLQTLEGHSSNVNCVTFSRGLASGSEDGTVKIWDVNSGQCVQTLRGHTHRITSVAFSHDSTRLASASEDETVKVWDASSGVCLQTLKGHTYWPNSVAFSNDLARLVWVSWDNRITVQDLNSGQCLHTFHGHKSDVMSVAFSHNSTWLASASDDKTIKIWDVNSGACLRTLEGHSSFVTSISFSQTRLASASWDMTVKIWDANSGDCLHTLEGHSEYVDLVAFSHDSTKLASASEDGTVKIWNASTGECLQTLEGHAERSMAFSHDSTRLASAPNNGIVKIWDVSSSECLQDIERHNNEVTLIIFSLDRTQIASASEDRTVKIWDATSGVCLQTLKEHGGAVYSLNFSRNSRRLASGSSGGGIVIWDAKDDECLSIPEGHKHDVNSVVFSHDSALLASASRDQTVKVWNVFSGECLYMLEGHSHFINSVIFSHDSTRLASASSENIVKVWDANNGTCLQTFEGHGDFVSSVVFSHNSTKLASASNDKTVKVWDTNNGTCLQTFEGHGDFVSSVVFSHNSTKLASASNDKTVKVWDASSGACLQTLNIGKILYSLFFDSNSSFLRTEIGLIAIHGLGTSSETAVVEPARPQYLGISLSFDGIWIMHDGRNVLWIPPEYRPSCSAVSGNTVSMGVGSGRVWTCSVHPDTSVC